VAGALSEVVPTERVYRLSLGSKQGNAHLHWHVAPIPPGVPYNRFIQRLSYHYEQVNYIHPFREGNGRTQRVFWNRIAADAGWQLDWRPVRGTVNDHASRAAAEQRDFGPLEQMFDQIVSKAAHPRERNETWRAAERARMSFGRERADDDPSDT